MKRQGLSNSFATVLFVVGILLGAGGYYLVTTVFVPSQSSAFRPTTSISQSTASASRTITSISQSTTGTEPPCPIATPLKLESVYYYNSFLVTVWTNCSDQQISFSVHLSPLSILTPYGLNATISTYGKISYIIGDLRNYPPTLSVVTAHSNTTVSLQVYFTQAYSPNAIIESVSGNVTAIDPVTGQALSSPVAFNLKPT
jgi:hypothetical protein